MQRSRNRAHDYLPIPSREIRSDGATARSAQGRGTRSAARNRQDSRSCIPNLRRRTMRCVAMVRCRQTDLLHFRSSLRSYGRALRHHQKQESPRFLLATREADQSNFSCVLLEVLQALEFPGRPQAGGRLDRFRRECRQVPGPPLPPQRAYRDARLCRAADPPRLSLLCPVSLIASQVRGPRAVVSGPTTERAVPVAAKRKQRSSRNQRRDSFPARYLNFPTIRHCRKGTEDQTPQ